VPDNSGTAPAKLAACWFDILLLAVVLLCGSALWTGARRGTIWLRQHHQPDKFVFDRAAGGPTRRAELAAVEKQYETVRAAQMDAEMSIARLSAELQAETRHPPAPATGAVADEWTRAQRDRQVKLDAAFLSSKALTADAASKLQRVIDARDAIADAERIVGMRYLDATHEFEIVTRLWTIVVMMLAAWTGVHYGGRWVGKCNRAFVLIPAFAVLGALVCYELLK
jgi:hypothetical protein